MRGLFPAIRFEISIQWALEGQSGCNEVWVVFFVRLKKWAGQARWLLVLAGCLALAGSIRVGAANLPT